MIDSTFKAFFARKVAYNIIGRYNKHIIIIIDRSDQEHQDDSSSIWCRGSNSIAFDIQFWIFHRRKWILPTILNKLSLWNHYVPVVAGVGFGFLVLVLIDFISGAFVSCFVILLFLFIISDHNLYLNYFVNAVLPFFCISNIEWKKKERTDNNIILTIKLHNNKSFWFVLETFFVRSSALEEKVR